MTTLLEKIQRNGNALAATYCRTVKAMTHEEFEVWCETDGLYLDAERILGLESGTLLDEATEEEVSAITRALVNMYAEGLARSGRTEDFFLTILSSCH